MATTRTPVWIDCDNTFGLPGQEIDDGLTILYLLAQDAVEIVGISATHGNGSIPEVVTATRRLLDRIGSSIPFFEGASPPPHPAAMQSGSWRGSSDAARALARAASESEGRLVVLGLGALSNLAGAAEIDPEFASKLAGVKVMGGYLAPLRFKREVEELNFSADPEAAHRVLNLETAVTIMSAQLCLGARFGSSELRTLNRGPRWLRTAVRRWAGTFGKIEGARGFYLWDLLPAVAVVEPRRFPSRHVTLTSNVDDMSSGRLRFEELTDQAEVDPRAAGVVDLPDEITRGEAFVAECAHGWTAGAASTARRSASPF